MKTRRRIGSPRQTYWEKWRGGEGEGNPKRRGAQPDHRAAPRSCPSHIPRLHAQGPQRAESDTRVLGRPELQLGGQHKSQDDDDDAPQPQRVGLQPGEVTPS